MKYQHLLMLLAIFIFNSCAQKQAPIVVYRDANVSKLVKWGKHVYMPKRAVVNKPISIKEAFDRNDKDSFVAVKSDQIINASERSMEVRRQLSKAMDGLEFYEFMVDNFNRIYTNKN